LYDPFVSLLTSPWDEGECRKTEAAFVRLIASLIWSSDGAQLAASSFGVGAPMPFIGRLPVTVGNLITIWNADGQVLRTLQQPKPFFELSNNFAFVAADKQVAAPTLGSEKLAFWVFEVESGEIVHEIPATNHDPQNRTRALLLVASPDQSILAATFPGTQPVALYSTRDWSKLADLPDAPRNDAQTPNAAAFSRDGRLLAVGTGRDVLVYDVSSRQAVQRINAFETPGNYVSHVAFSPDGNLIAASTPSTDRPVRVFSTKDASPAAVYSEPAGDIFGLAWSPDGRFIAFISGYRRLHLWAPTASKTNEQTIDLSGGAHSTALALSPDGSRLAVNVEQDVRVFDVVR
jgi:WD40 repeat protein